MLKKWLQLLSQLKHMQQFSVILSFFVRLFTIQLILDKINLVDKTQNIDICTFFSCVKN